MYHRIKKLILDSKDYFSFYKFDEKVATKKQNRIFNKIGCSRRYGIKILNNLQKKYPNLKSQMSSEHQIIFSSLNKRKFKHILEIGTYDGSNALLLSELFPKANIDTIDLNDNDETFIDTYGRKNKDNLSEFLIQRKKNLKKKNIKFKKKNSVSLTLEKKKYDLIWVDGAHGYPVVSIDIANSLRLLKKGGIFLCDDVYLFTDNEDPMYISTATIETLKLFKNANLIEFELIYKRLDKKNNSNRRNTKFIGVVKKVK